MKKIGLQLVIAVFSVAALHAQSETAQTARLVIRNGIVEVQRGNVWLPIGSGEAFNSGERVRTGAGSSAAIEIGSGKVITLNEQSQALIVQSSQGPVMQLESGSMKAFSQSNGQVVANDAALETATAPVADPGPQAGPTTVSGVANDPTLRTYTANSSAAGQNVDTVVPNPVFYVVPYFVYPNWVYPNAVIPKPDPNEGKIVPPVVNNPTHPGYRPTQIVPPMPDPLHVPVTKP